MNKLFSLPCGIMLVTLGLVGCGGGGGGSSAPKPTPVSSVVPATSSSSVQSSSLSSSSLSSSSQASSSLLSSSAVSSSVIGVQPSSSSSSSSLSSSSLSLASSSVAAPFTIRGTAGADALAEGEISVVIGARSYKAAIDVDKTYSLKLDVPELDLDKPFAAIATGAGSDKWVKLAAFYPSVRALTEKSGSDKILDASEYAGANITLLTTAEYAEIMNSGLPVTTDAQRRAAIFNLQPIKVLEQAAVLSRVLNYINVDLPIQSANTLDYLLDADLAESYLEILRISDKWSLDDEIKTIQGSSVQVSVSAKKIVGHYFLEAESSQYFLTFNSDGSGALKTTTMHSKMLSSDSENAKFTWQRKGKVVKLDFSEAVELTTNSINVAEDGNIYNCDESSTSQVELCKVTFKSVQLDLISELDFRYIANLKLDIDAVKEANSAPVYSGSLKAQLARLMPVDDFAAVTVNDLIGFEWISDKYAYVFSANGTVKQTNLASKTERTVNWTLEKSHILIDGLDLWITHNERAGFSVISVDSATIYRTSLIKRTAVSLQESDWVGRWASYRAGLPSTAYDVNADKTWRDGFENGSLGNWSRVDGHRYTALSNGAWRMTRDVLAIHDGKYYLSVCQGVEATPFAPIGCYLSEDSLSKNYSSHIFWNNWSYPVFNEKVSNGSWTYMLGAVIYSATSTSILEGGYYTKVSPTRLFNTRTNTIVEMTAATQNGIELCEYTANSSCREKDKRNYERGLEIGLTRNTGGFVYHDISFINHDAGFFKTEQRSVDKVFMVPKNTAQRLIVQPNLGYTANVTGCGGALVGQEYRIPALSANCEITVNFRR